MQRGYGIADIPQYAFLAAGGGVGAATDECCSSLFSQSNHNHHHQQQQQEAEQHIFQNLHPIPITQQFFQNHQFHAFQRQRVIGLESESAQEAINFKLGLNENSYSRDDDGEENVSDEGLINGIANGNEISETRQPLLMHNLWQPHEDSSIKQPFWKTLNADQTNMNHKRSNDDVEKETLDGGRIKDHKISKQVSGNEGEGNKYRLFGELEAIYGRAAVGESNQMGSQNHDSETSIGEEAALVQKLKKKNKKRKMKEQLTTMASFFERLVKEMINHQEGLHKKFVEAVEAMDKHRIEREEGMRRREESKFSIEAITRANEQALASSREAAIVSYLEKITGERAGFATTKESKCFETSNITNKRNPKKTKENMDIVSRETNGIGVKMNANLELLDAIVVGKEHDGNVEEDEDHNDDDARVGEAIS